MRNFITALFLSMAAAFGVTPVRAELPVLRIAVLPVGTVNWELDTIRHHGLDTANGFTLEVQGVAGGAAAAKSVSQAVRWIKAGWCCGPMRLRNTAWI